MIAPTPRPPGYWKTLLFARDAGYETVCLEIHHSHRNSRGYGNISIRGKTYGVHRLAWTEANGDPGELKVCHHCDNPPCARLDHLFVGTDAENMQDASAKGRLTHQRGEANSQAKLTEHDVLAIRSLAGIVSQDTLGRAFGVNRSLISMIINRKRWWHL